jgi:hypothetical protein
MRWRGSPVFESFSGFDFSVCFDLAARKALISLGMTPELACFGHFDFRLATGVLIVGRTLDPRWVLGPRRRTRRDGG